MHERHAGRTRDAVRAGATLVLMSGDKLLGGPQAGIVLGDAATVESLRRDPLARALRVDKLTLAALEATLALYRDPESAAREIPALGMLTASQADVKARADAARQVLAARGVACEVSASEASVGGGAFPTARIPSAALAFGGDVAALERRLRTGVVPVVGRVSDGRLLLDLRSVPAAHDAGLLDAVTAAFQESA
jgi:L-seryl-tRNA(Ser) seleniumtransferase